MSYCYCGCYGCKTVFLYFFTMLIRLCCLPTFCRSHVQIIFGAESYGNLWIMIRTLFLMIYEMSNVHKTSFKYWILSLNVRGITSFHKQKVLFHWCMKDKADVIFLQETYSIPKVGNVWKFQWRGELSFRHGSAHSGGACDIFWKPNFQGWFFSLPP